MLALDSPRWRELVTAYGSAVDVPALLRTLARTPGHEGAWSQVWSSLCHQYSVYPATYAAVPHIVDIALELELEHQLPYLTFVGAVACAPDAAPVPDDLRDDYQEALAQAKILVGAAIHSERFDGDTLLGLLQSAAALWGCPWTARALDELAREELHPDCPACTASLYVAIDGTALTATAENPTTEVVSRETRVIPPAQVPEPARELSEDPWTEDDAPGQLLALALAARDAEVSELLVAWEGNLPCPACGHVFALRPALVAKEARQAQAIEAARSGGGDPSVN